jgi:general stress protein 26
MPVWGVWDSGALYFSTSRESRKARNLERSPEVVVHLESGDDVVILEGAVERVGLEERVANAYEAKYDYRPSSDDTGDGAWLELRPRVAYAWREEDFPRTATRWSWKAGRRSSVS